MNRQIIEDSIRAVWAEMRPEVQISEAELDEQFMVTLDRIEQIVRRNPDLPEAGVRREALSIAMKDYREMLT